VSKLVVKILLVVCMAVSGCAARLPPFVTESLNCNISSDMLTPCTQPIKIQDGVTYAQIIDIVLEDRENLRKCAQRQESLAGAAMACKQATDTHNQHVKEFNAQNGAGK